MDEALWARSEWGWRPGDVLCTHTQAPWHPGILPEVRSSAGMKTAPGRLGQWAGGRVYHCTHQLSHDARPRESSLETHPIHLDPLAPTGMRWGRAVRQDRPRGAERQRGVHCLQVFKTYPGCVTGLVGVSGATWVSAAPGGFCLKCQPGQSTCWGYPGNAPRESAHLWSSPTRDSGEGHLRLSPLLGLPGQLEGFISEFHKPS